MAFNPKNMSLVGTASIQRTLPKGLRRGMKLFGQRVGQVVWASNYCHSAFHMLFCMLIHRQQLQLGNAIWHSQHNDNAQREALLAGARVVLRTKEEMLGHVEWAIDCANALAAKRNDAIHIAPAFTLDKPFARIIVNPMATAPKRSERLANEDLKRLFRTLTGDFVALAGYVRLLDGALHHSAHFSLPKRPRLRSIPPKAAKKKSRPQHKGHRPPQQSSRA